MTSITDDGEVEFRFFRRDARSVQILGSFADDAVPMRTIGDGWWTAVACFGAGEYRFKYQADGELFPGYAANGVECVRSGIRSVLVVPGNTKTTETDASDKEQNKTAKRVA